MIPSPMFEQYSSMRHEELLARAAERRRAGDAARARWRRRRHAARQAIAFRLVEAGLRLSRT